MAPIYSEEEFKHWFLPRDDVIYTYVVENANNEITDFASFYKLPSTGKCFEKKTSGRLPVGVNNFGLKRKNINTNKL